MRDEFETPALAGVHGQATDGIDFDGIYGEADTWLPDDEIDAALEEAGHHRRPAQDRSIPDIDDYRKSHCRPVRGHRKH